MAMATPGTVKVPSTLATYASKPGGGAAGCWAMAGTRVVATSATRTRYGWLGANMAENVWAAGRDGKAAALTIPSPGAPS